MVFMHELLMLKYLTNRFHVAVRLFSNRSQMTSKCGKNISDTLQHGIYLFYIIKKLKYTEKIPFHFKFRHFDRHENSTDVIL